MYEFWEIFDISAQTTDQSTFALHKMRTDYDNAEYVGGTITELQDVLEAVDMAEAIETYQMVTLPYDKEVSVEYFSLKFSGTELLALQLLLMGTMVLCFSYVRMISREHGIMPTVLHKFFCPMLSVLRWEGFEGDTPIYAMLFGCFYTVFCWTPAETEGEEDSVADLEDNQGGYSYLYYNPGSLETGQSKEQQLQANLLSESKQVLLV